VAKEIFKDKKLLTHFVRQVYSLPDTPSLIQLVAGNENYLRLCGDIVDASVDDGGDIRLLTAICRTHGIDFHMFREKLVPVAGALGLALSPERRIDYYELLGVPRNAATPDIKKAFRQKVRGVHPDTSRRGTKSSREFMHLKTAYQVLRDPALRQQYDDSLPADSLWREKAPETVTGNRTGRNRIFFQLGIIFLLLIITVFIFDFVYRQNSIFDDDNRYRQSPVTRESATTR
jgi:hypothetical protein